MNGINLDPGAVLSLNGTHANYFSAFANGTSPASALYTGTTLTLYIAPNQTMQKGLEHTFSFTFINPRLDQPHGNVLISASSLYGSGAMIKAQAMRFSRNGTILGVVDGAKPLKCVIPSFKGSQMVQSNPIAGLNNIITFSLKSNVNLAHSELSTIRIRGFQNAISPRLVTLLSTGSTEDGTAVFGLTGVFEDETLLLTVVPGQTMIAEVTYEFAFEIQNPQQPQLAPAISIEANGTALFQLEPFPGTHLNRVGVLNGSDPLLTIIPQFLVRDISQSQPFTGYTNTYTCLLTTNINLAFSERRYLHHAYPGRSIITISGFTDSVGGSSIALGTTLEGHEANRLFSDSGTSSSTAEYASGAITLHLHVNQTMEAHVPYALTFQLLNPDYEQSTARKISISATGSANISTVPLAVPSRLLYGISNGTDPLVMVRTQFKVYDIRQSNPLATLINTITVSLVASLHLGASDGALIRINGIVNAVTPSFSVPLFGGNGTSLFSHEPGSAAAGRLLYVNQTIFLHLATNQTMLKDHLYVFKFNVTNPRRNQEQGNVQVSAACSKGSKASIPAQRMRAPNITVLGVADGSNPLLVVIPSFKRSVIAQSDPLVDRSNVITLTLISNVNLYAHDHSVIIISNLQNMLSPQNVQLFPTRNDSSHLLFADPGSALSGSAAFHLDALTLTVAAGSMITAEEFYEFKFHVTNPGTEQPAPRIIIRASGTALFEPERLATPHLPIVGVINGSDVMLIEQPKFDIKAIAQSMPLAFYRNIFTVTLQSNVNLAYTDASVIHMTGLEYAIGPSSIELDTTPNGYAGNDLFSNGTSSARTATFINGTVTLFLHENKTMHSHVPYVITFILTNPDSKIDSSLVHVGRVDSSSGFVPPAIMSISARGTATIPVALMIYPNEPLLGIPNGANPLVLMYEPRWYYATIAQSNPLAQEPNVLTIRFATNIDLRGRDQAIITGLCKFTHPVYVLCLSLDLFHGLHANRL